MEQDVLLCTTRMTQLRLIVSLRHKREVVELRSGSVGHRYLRMLVFYRGAIALALTCQYFRVISIKKQPHDPEI